MSLRAGCSKEEPFDGKQQAADVLEDSQQTIATRDAEISHLNTEHHSELQAMKTNHATEQEDLK